jgi:hypothetical protein
MVWIYFLVRKTHIRHQNDSIVSDSERKHIMVKPFNDYYTIVKEFCAYYDDSAMKVVELHFSESKVMYKNEKTFRNIPISRLFCIEK